MPFKRLLRRLADYLDGSRMARALKRHNEAAAALDAAVKEMLEK